MDWQGLKRHLLTQHTHEPQTLARIEVALASAQEALQILAGHGHQYHLAPGAGDPFPDWPRKLYHVDLSPNGRTVYTEAEAQELGPGWFDTLQRAQFWDGLETQFNGRGGIPKTSRSLTAPPREIVITENEMKRLEELKAEVLAFREAHRWRTANAEQESEAAQLDGGCRALSKVRQDCGNEA